MKKIEEALSKQEDELENTDPKYKKKAKIEE